MLIIWHIIGTIIGITATYAQQHLTENDPRSELNYFLWTQHEKKSAITWDNWMLVIQIILCVGFFFFICACCNSPSCRERESAAASDIRDTLDLINNRSCSEYKSLGRKVVHERSGIRIV